MVKRMALENLYQCTQDEVSILYKEFTTAFFNDDLYKIAFPDLETRRDCMDYFFKHYIDAIAPDCMFFADSAAMNCVMVVYDSRKYNRKYNKRTYVKRLLQMNFRFLHFIKLMGFMKAFRLVKEWEMFSSRWTKDFVIGPHFHLDLIFTMKEKSCQGLATRLIEELVDEGNIMSMDVTIETHHKDHAQWYEGLGFVLMNTIVYAGSDLHQYCLLARHSKES